MKRVADWPRDEGAPEGWGVFYIRRPDIKLESIVRKRIELWAQECKTGPVRLHDIGIKVKVTLSMREWMFSVRDHDATKQLNFLGIYLERPSDTVMFKLWATGDEDFEFVEKLPEAWREPDDRLELF